VVRPAVDGAVTVIINSGPSAGAVPLTMFAASVTEHDTSPVCVVLHTTLYTPDPGASDTYVTPAGKWSTTWTTVPPARGPVPPLPRLRV